ncbi:hypothetical protein [Aestuariicoccus sp. MJ-SS9]|uniref:hypothetical protein n=1 Tax=Aestuariicoccus sp. MJ-SS9 TaxID=3079855 RepID=UPI002913C1CC|nr:hypothetical protein [Aestuariicoccus sp. MJ-SS9]MDU8912568.1 hypothetical protein [Aestuariicoccus sp. MJ-SS9]
MRHIICLLIALAAAGDARAATIYECLLTPSAENRWLADFVFIGHDAAADRVVVSDILILSFNDRAPVEGRIVTDNARRITFAWELFVRGAGGQSARMSYRLTYQRGDGSAMATARPLGYDRLFQAAGQCEVKQRN